MKIIETFTTPLYHLLARLSPELNTRRIYYSYYHKAINLKAPETFDEKIQWLKLNRYGHDPLIRQCADKYAVRQFVADRGCSETLNDLYAVYTSVDEICWDKLPQKFVLKMNTGSGYNLVCADKSKLDIDASKAKLRRWCRESRDFYMRFSEMQYKDIEPKILCERFIESDDGLLPADYKLFC